MAHPGHRIRLLAASLQDDVKSMVAVPCMSQAVAACLKNSIQAKCKSIAISVNYKDLAFCVEDDGRGMTADGMQNVGQQAGGRRTDKSAECRDASLHAIAQLSRLDIDTRAKGSFDTIHKTIHAGQLLKMGLSMRPRTRSGTSIEVSMFLFNQPVRRKLLAQTRFVIRQAPLSNRSPTNTLPISARKIWSSCSSLYAR